MTRLAVDAADENSGEKKSKGEEERQQVVLLPKRGWMVSFLGIRCWLVHRLQQHHDATHILGLARGSPGVLSAPTI